MEQRGRQAQRGSSNQRYFSRSRGRAGRFRGGFSGRAQMEHDREQAYTPQQREIVESEQQNKPDGPTGFVNIRSAKSRAPIKAEVKKINLEKYYRDWLEEERKNVLLDFNLHTESEINSYYTDKLDDVVTKRYHSDDRVEEYQGYFKAGICLAISLRLITTASQSQKNSDLKMKRLKEDLKEYRVPDSYNVMLQAIGKFTDDSFGNVRIAGAMCRAKQKILQGMSHAYSEHWKANFEFETGGFQKFKGLLDGTIPFENVVFRDKDSLDYLKLKMQQRFEELDKLTYIVKLKDVNNRDVAVPVAPPRYDFQNATIASMVSYIKKLEIWGDLKMPGGTDTVRDVFGSLALFSVLKISFLASDDDVEDHYPDLAGTYLAKYKCSEFLTYLNALDGEQICSSEKLVQNAFTISRIYNETIVMIMEQEYKFSDLVNNEFGSDAQYIQCQQTEIGRGRESVPSFRSMTKRIIKENVVLGGLFSFVRDIKTKRRLTNNLGTQRNVILADFVANDYKYK